LNPCKVLNVFKLPLFHNFEGSWKVLLLHPHKHESSRNDLGRDTYVLLLFDIERQPRKWT
jgi:hypothetical protein